MTCESFEPQIALLVEGDLSEMEAARVETHLRTCASCRAFRTELIESQNALKSLAREDLDPAALAAVRRRVRHALGQESGRRERWIPWALAASIFAVAAALWLVALRRPEPRAPEATAEVAPRPPAAPPQSPAPTPAPAVEEAAAVRRAEAPSRAPRGVPRPRRDAPPDVRESLAAAPEGAAAPAEGPLVIKLVTTDPDVVIYWLVEPNGGKS